MRPLPTDNRRPAFLLAVLAGLASAVIAVSATVWVQYQAADRGYTTELRRTLRKYGDAAAVPGESLVWLGRVHVREPDKVRRDLMAAAEDRTAFDPLEPLHLPPSFLVGLYLDLGFLGLWVAFTCVGVLVALPVITLINRQAQPPRRRPPDLAWG